jgi:hypothetical protein
MKQLDLSNCCPPDPPVRTTTSWDEISACGRYRSLVGRLNNLRRTFHAAADRAELPRIRPNLGLRASHGTLRMARGYPYEYVRQVLGHEGEVSAEVAVDGVLRPRTARHASTLARHYLRPSPDLLRAR